MGCVSGSLEYPRTDENRKEEIKAREERKECAGRGYGFTCLAHILRRVPQVVRSVVGCH